MGRCGEGETRRGRDMRKCTTRRILIGAAIFLVANSVVVLAQSTSPSPAAAECPELKSRLDRAENRLRDWPAHERYRNENMRLVPPSGNEKRVVFMGDSITDSWDNQNNGGFFPGKPYVN